jgi:2-polyprenyl-3-methyl-5-hydroxy-6-metoxy-1,4-benzoquinol methylase
MNQSNLENPAKKIVTEEYSAEEEGASKLTQFDEVSEKYAHMTNIDPAKRFVQYPESLRLAGDLKNKKVLDIGCANGMFTRMMARAGAEVVGYDPSKQEVKAAKEAENEEPLGIKYIVADRLPTSPENKFDLATAVMVLPMAEDEGKMEDVFSGAYHALGDNGKLVCLTVNPEYKRLGEKVYNRRFTKLDDKHNKVEFFDDKGDAKLIITGSRFSTAEYEQAAIKSGFKKVVWEKLHIDQAGINQLGNEFWDKFEDDCPYIGLVAYK